MGLFPKLPGDWEGIDIDGFPPGDFIAGLMQLSMVSPTKRHSELIADFNAQVLSVAQSAGDADRKDDGRKRDMVVRQQTADALYRGDALAQPK